MSSSSTSPTIHTYNNGININGGTANITNFSNSARQESPKASPSDQASGTPFSSVIAIPVPPVLPPLPASGSVGLVERVPVQRCEISGLIILPSPFLKVIEKRKVHEMNCHLKMYLDYLPHLVEDFSSNEVVVASDDNIKKLKKKMKDMREDLQKKGREAYQAEIVAMAKDVGVSVPDRNQIVTSFKGLKEAILDWRGSPSEYFRLAWDCVHRLLNKEHDFKQKRLPEKITSHLQQKYKCTIDIAESDVYTHSILAAAKSQLKNVKRKIAGYEHRRFQMSLYATRHKPNDLFDSNGQKLHEVTMESYPAYLLIQDKDRPKGVEGELKEKDITQLLLPGKESPLSRIATRVLDMAEEHKVKLSTICERIQFEGKKKKPHLMGDEMEMEMPSLDGELDLDSFPGELDLDSFPMDPSLFGQSDETAQPPPQQQSDHQSQGVSPPHPPPHQLQMTDHLN